MESLFRGDIVKYNDRGINTEYEKEIFNYKPDLTGEIMKVPFETSDEENIEDEVEEEISEIQKVIEASKTTSTDDLMDKVNSAIINMNDACEYLNNYDGLFNNSIDSLRNAMLLYYNLSSYISNNPINDDSIKVLTDEEAVIEGLQETLSSIESQIDISEVPEENEDTSDDDIIKEYIETRNSLRKEMTKLSAMEYNMGSISDLSEVVTSFANDIDSVSENLQGAVEVENDVMGTTYKNIFRQADDEFKTTAKSSVINDIKTELDNSNRIMNEYITPDTIDAAIKRFDDTKKERASLIPAAKSLFSINMDECTDITASTFDDIHKACVRSELNYKSALNNIIKLLGASNKIAIKAVSNELKINRFNNI